MSDRLPGIERSLDEAIEESLSIVEAAKGEHKPSRTFLLYSGGNDSQVLLHAMARHADEIVHVDTGIGIEAVAPFCRSIASSYPLPYTELSPPRSYDSLVLARPNTIEMGWDGLPGPAGCTATPTRGSRNGASRSFCVVTAHSSASGSCC